MIKKNLLIRISMSRVIILIIATFIFNSCALIKLVKNKNNEKLITNNGFNKFEIVNRHIAISSTFSSGERKNMTLDLGAGSSLLLKNSGLEYIESLEPKLSYGKFITAEHKAVKNTFYPIGTINTPAFKLENAFFPIIPNYQVNPCNPFVGIWGADVFADKFLIIQMQDSTLAILDSLPSLDGWTIADSKYSYPHFYIYINIWDKKIKFMFDTGCTGDILMNLYDFEKTFSEKSLPISDKKKYYGNTFITGSGKVEDTTSTALLDQASISLFQLNSASITLSEKIKANVIGIEVIKQFNWILDFKNEKLYLQPNPNYHYTKTMSPLIRLGFSMYVIPDGNIEVNSLQVGSPAENAGLKIRDQIISINDIKTEIGANCEIIKTFNNAFDSQNDNEIIVRRGDEILEFHL